MVKMGKKIIMDKLLLRILLICYLFKNEIGYNFFTLLLGLFFITLIFQVFMFDKNKKESCLKMFKTNNLSGLIFFLSILTLNN